MKQETLARVTIPGPRPNGWFLTQARLPGEEAEHPYGQWSLFIEPQEQTSERTFSAAVSFVGPDAPHDRLNPGVRLELFRGVFWVGTATIEA